MELTNLSPIPETFRQKRSRLYLQDHEIMGSYYKHTIWDKFNFSRGNNLFKANHKSFGDSRT